MSPLSLVRLVTAFSVPLFATADVLADPPMGPPGQAPSPPIAATPPLACMTKNFLVQAVFTGTSFPSPNTALCNGKPCLDFSYTVTPLIAGAVPNIDHVAFSVSATQVVLGPPDVQPTGTVFGISAGDPVTGFLALAQHEYAIRF